MSRLLYIYETIQTNGTLYNNINYILKSPKVSSKTINYLRFIANINTHIKMSTY